MVCYNKSPPTHCTHLQVIRRSFMLCSSSIGCTRDTSRAPGRPPAPLYALLLGGAGPGGQGAQEDRIVLMMVSSTTIHNT
jgi:hypothetical protein